VPFVAVQVLPEALELAPVMGVAQGVVQQAAQQGVGSLTGVGTVLGKQADHVDGARRVVPQLGQTQAQTDRLDAAGHALRELRQPAQGGLGITDCP